MISKEANRISKKGACVICPRINERPGPSSWHESFDQSRNMEFMERPQTHGTSDMWSGRSDDRRAFKGGTDRGFMSNRSLDRQIEDRRSFQRGMERGFMGDKGMDRPRSWGRW